MAAKLCNVCNLRRPKTGSKGTETSPHSDMCNYCFEEGGHENTHSDYNHAAIIAQVEDEGTTDNLTEHDKEELTAMAGCWICHPELNLAQQPTKTASTTTKKQGVRRPQFNHKGHNHPQTPAARRACKEAFWKLMTELNTPETKLPEAQANWDYECDGFGKVLTKATPKGGWAGVAPLGPKGGTGVSLKAAGAKAKAINASKK